MANFLKWLKIDSHVSTFLQFLPVPVIKNEFTDSINKLLSSFPALSSYVGNKNEGGKMKKMADYCIHVEINDMQIAEDLHMVLDHMMMWVLCHSKREIR